MTGAEHVGDRLAQLYLALEGMHAWRGWHWWPDADPFEVIVGSILVQNTMWTNVERALDMLRSADALVPEAMAALTLAEIEALIRPSGQYRQKAKKLRAFLDTMDAHGGLETLLALPASELRRVLLTTWGIGPETADCIIVYAAGQPALVIDAYTQRLFSRLGLGPGATTDYAAWQRWFLANLPGASPRYAEPWRDFLARYHALIVMHCKHLCLKTRPKCGECTLLEQCPGSPMRA